MAKPEWLTCGEILDAVTNDRASALPDWVVEELSKHDYSFVINIGGTGISIRREGAAWGYDRSHIFLRASADDVYVVNREYFDRVYARIDV